MTQIILIIIGVAIVLILLSRKSRSKIVGICAVALGQDVKKQERKEKIITMLTDQESVSNADIVERFGVSPRTVVNYMDELEREGRAEQIGDTGRGVHYRLKSTQNP